MGITSGEDECRLTDGAGRIELAALWQRATGGAGVAAAPTDLVDDSLPDASGAPGLTEISEMFEERMRVDGRPLQLFLVGGPGAGKSYTSARLVQGLERLDDSPSYLAERSYAYRGPHRVIRLINDATIPSLDRSGLSDEITKAATANEDLIACVNRGVLVEEAAMVADSRQTVGIRVVQWLAAGTRHSDEVSDASGRIANHGILRILNFGGIDVAVVFLDVWSLFEEVPRIQIHQNAASADIVTSRSDVKVHRLTERHLTTFPTPAGDLLDRLINQIESGEGATNPVTANVASLQSSQVRASLLTILRSAEIVAGRRFTYRELWGALVRCIVGGLSAEVPEGEATEAIAALDADSRTTRPSFEALFRVSQYRWSNSIFATLGHGDPVGALTSQVDPVKDVIPGRFRPDAPHSGWGTPVLDAMAQGIAGGEGPLRQLLSQDPEGLLGLMTTPYDLALDDAYVHLMKSASDRLHAEHARKYGRYLTRLYAAANGVTAFREEISEWTNAHNLEQLPSRLRSGLRTLLVPSRDPDDPGAPVLLPLFDSRTIPVQGFVTDPMLVVHASRVDLALRINGDDLTVIVSDDLGAQKTDLSLDFPLVREALACRGGYIGATDMSPSLAPRLERTRAARIAGVRTEGVAIARGSEQLEVYVGAGGN